MTLKNWKTIESMGWGCIWCVIMDIVVRNTFFLQKYNFLSFFSISCFVGPSLRIVCFLWSIQTFFSSADIQNLNVFRQAPMFSELSVLTTNNNCNFLCGGAIQKCDASSEIHIRIMRCSKDWEGKKKHDKTIDLNKNTKNEDMPSMIPHYLNDLHNYLWIVIQPCPKVFQPRLDGNHAEV